MWSRVGTFLFILFTIAGFWYQRRMMRIWSEEFQVEITADRAQTELVRLDQFTYFVYEKGVLTRSLRGDQGFLNTDGQLNVFGNVNYFDFDEKGAQKSFLTTSEATGKLVLSEDKESMLEAMRSLDTLDLPKKVHFGQKSDVITTHKLTLKFLENKLRTDEEVVLVGAGKTMKGKGFVYDLKTGEFDLGGPVEGFYNPPEARTESETPSNDP